MIPQRYFEAPKATYFIPSSGGLMMSHIPPFPFCSEPIVHVESDSLRDTGSSYMCMY